MKGEVSDNREGRQIVHLDLDTFFVSVERLHDRRLEGRPVIVGGASERGVVASCSYEARRWGVHSGMPVAMARRLCPEAVVIRGDHALYRRHSEAVAELIEERVPLYERASIDEFYLDMTGMDRFFGTLRWTRELRDTIVRKTGLPLSFALSVNKTVAKIATGEAKPAGELTVPAEEVQPFLDPLSVRKIPMVGKKNYELLRSMGVGRIATLRAIPPELLQRLLGSQGLLLWKKARGIDDSPVVNERLRKSIGTEETFDHDTTDTAFLLRTLVRMTEKSAYELRRRGRMASLLTVKIRYSDFETHTLQRRIPLTVFDHELIAVARELFLRLYTRRVRVRLLGIRLGGLVPGTQQLHLFDDDGRMARLYHALDHLRDRYGPLTVRRAGAAPPPTPQSPKYREPDKYRNKTTKFEQSSDQLFNNDVYY